MRAILTAAAGVFVILAADVQTIEAQVSSGRNPWCLRAGVAAGGRGSWDCSYHNRWQCEQSAHGSGGYCVRNPNYRGRRR